jgi:circadian clock protein KaiB
VTPVHLRLYLTGRTVSAESARTALAALESRLIADHGAGAVVSEIIDVLETPEVAARDDVFATPTLVRLSPSPSMRVFGDLSSVTRLLAGLGLADAPAMVEDDRPWPPLALNIFSSPAAVLE